MSSISETAVKRLPTVTEAEVKQVMLAQFKYAYDRMHGGGRGNDGRAIERSGNGSGTSNPQLWENYYCNYLGLSDKTAVIFRGKFASSFCSSDMIHIEKMKINWVNSFLLFVAFQQTLLHCHAKKAKNCHTWS